MGKNVLIMIPGEWYIEECCVKPSSTIAPTGALVLAAYLRKLGHTPDVLVQGASMSLRSEPDIVIMYAPWFAFSEICPPVFKAFKARFPRCTTILIMYESLADFEIQAMKECPDIDYAVLPHEKEISVGVIVEHGDPVCLGGFGPKAGIVYRDENGQPKEEGRRTYARDLSHLPYSGNELHQHVRANPGRHYTSTQVLLQRGCSETCIFCPVRCTRARYRDPDIVLGEVAAAHELFGKSGCGTMTHEVLKKPRRLEEFADAILSRNVEMEWTIGTRCDYVSDLQLLKKLKAAGVKELYLGIELATEEARQRVKKPIKDADILRTLELFRLADLAFHAAFVIGFPWEDNGVMQATADYVRWITSHENCTNVILSKLIPYPGLPIEEELVREGILTQKTTFHDWNHRLKELKEAYGRTKYLDTASLENWYQRLLGLVHDLGKERVPA